MILKELSKIIIDAENGTLRFEDANNSLKDFGAVKFIYDQKNDAEICEAFVEACYSMADELKYEGIELDINKNKKSFGIFDTSAVELETLRKSDGLVNFLMEGTRNQIVVDTTRKNYVKISVGTQSGNGREWSVFDDDRYYHTIAYKFIRFAEKFNERVCESNNDKKALEIKNYMARKHSKPTM